MGRTRRTQSSTHQLRRSCAHQSIRLRPTGSAGDLGRENVAGVAHALARVVIRVREAVVAVENIQEAGVGVIVGASAALAGVGGVVAVAEAVGTEVEVEAGSIEEIALLRRLKDQRMSNLRRLLI